MPGKLVLATRLAQVNNELSSILGIANGISPHSALQ